MATVNLIQSKRSQSKAGLKFILSYCKRDSKTVCGDKKLIGGVNCVAESAYHEMLSTKMRYGKTDGRMFYHLVQSFSPEENITPETAHEIALKFAEQEFPEYERKYITYITQDGKRCRDRSLHEEKYLKENMEYEFGIREIILGGTESEGAAEYAESLRSEALRNGNRAELERNARYAEGADRTALTAYDRNRNADDQRGTDGVYERAAEYPDREQRTVPSGGDGISEQDEEIGDGIYRLDENGRVGYRETGWEDQRLLFEQSLHADGYGGEVFEPDILDYGYSLGYNGAVLSDAAYLAADITGIIDDDAPVEDCTTMHFPSEHKKKHSGPVMGGM